MAHSLQADGLATFLIDLLTTAEDAIDRRTQQYRFDVPMLGRRLATIIDWLASLDAAAQLPLGLFGASTGAGAALIAAAERPKRVLAVVFAQQVIPDLAAQGTAARAGAHAVDCGRGRR